MHELPDSAPFFSVLLPSYNYAGRLSDAVASVRGQSTGDWELIAVDDGSEDESLDILRALAARDVRIRVLTHPLAAHRGIAETYRLAFHAARGGHLAFIEADDRWEPSHLERHRRILETHPEAGVSISGFLPEGSPFAVLYWRLYALANRLGLPSRRVFDALPAFLLRNPAATFSSVSIRRSVVKDSDWKGPEDRWTDWWLFAHLAQRAPFYYDAFPTVRWCIHPGSANAQSVTRAELRKLQDFLIALYDSLLSGPGSGGPQSGTIDETRRLMMHYRRNCEQDTLISHIQSILYRKRQALRFLIHLGLKHMLDKGRRV